jgi:hypothetical protein
MSFIRLEPMSELGNAVLRDELRLGGLRDDLTCGKIRGDLARRVKFQI